jgi:hypothetical protein
MNHLTAEEVNGYSAKSSVSEVAVYLDSITRHSIKQTPWVQYSYLPLVHVAISHVKDCIFLKYYVTEKTIRAVNREINSAVYEDSCVEFFIGFDDEKAYYNFEFNCIGTTLAGFGESREGRTMLDKDLINQVKCYSVINNQQGIDVNWELTVMIPFSLFCYHKLETLAGKNCKVNFYKCGDLLPTPHFVSWANIDWPEPNFHLPQFFGSLTFK